MTVPETTPAQEVHELRRELEKHKRALTDYVELMGLHGGYEFERRLLDSMDSVDQTLQRMEQQGTQAAH